jgi:hypothetical protein
MPVTFSLADDEARDRVDAMMRDWHPLLQDAGVIVGVLFASNEDGPALARKGATVAATMQVVSLKDRVLKKVDAQMVINRQVWEDLSPAQRDALVDHELEHLKLKKFAYWTLLGPDGKPRRGPDGEETGEQELRCELDDLGRPKLVTVPGDVDIGDGFRRVIETHGPAAMEYRNLTQAGQWATRALTGRDDPRAFADPAEDAA